MRRLLISALVAAIASGSVHAATQACDISTAMETSQKAERDRRMGNIDNSIQELNNLNELMNACLNNFPSMPTQMASSAALTSAFQQIRQKVCEGLVQKARNGYQQALNEAQNAGTNALNGQSGQQPIITTPPSVPISSPPQTPSSGGNAITDMMKRFFQ